MARPPAPAQGTEDPLMTATNTAPPPPDTERSGETARIVTGDRFCTKCGYNLIGQQIVREEHYALLIVRCPECATVASVQEYPLLGGWGVRWGVVLAALWFIALIGLWPASSGIVTGMCAVVSDEASRSYTRHLDRLYEAAQAQAANPPAQGPGSRIITIPGGQTIRFGPGGNFDKWWEQQDKAALLADAGGWRGAINGEAFLIMIPFGLMVFASGWLWAVCLLQLKRRWLIVCAAAILLLAMVFLAPLVMEWHTLAGIWSRYAAQQQLGLPVVVISLVGAAIALGLGLWLGRPLTRFSVRLLLPPRLCYSLAFLWTAEGLQPPSPRA
jgi:hypothetical protein